MSKRLFIVSNRLPINITTSGDRTEIKSSSGGLVSAMNSFLAGNSAQDEFTERFWVGVTGCTIPAWSKVSEHISNKDFNYLPVFINKKVYDSYYNGLSNSMLWPLFHYFPSYAEFNADHYKNYQQANKEFFDVLVKHLRPNDTVWIHDYHLLPLAGLIRNELPDITIGFFLHIPFPSYEIFRIMPKKWQEELLSGMLGADLVGFHTIDYASHFLKSAQLVLGLENDMHIVRYKNRLVKADVFPIGIDFRKFHDAYENEEVKKMRDAMKEQFNGRKLIFSVDRLDYTKGVYNRLKGYESFLKDYPQYHEKVVFVLVVVPSRDGISKYAERKKIIDEYIGNLNSRIGNINWQPIIYQYNTLNFHELVSMYTGCDLALITPLRDGMNLVAKEFVASRSDLRGVLILSEMAGAVKELTEALTINPNDIGEIGLKIKEGLEMEPEEQEIRIRKMQECIEQYDVVSWARDFFQQLELIKTKQKNFDAKILDQKARVELLTRYQSGGRRLLLLDYDGTLAPFAPQPGLARPSSALLELLNDLAQNEKNEVYVISGRDNKVLEEWFGRLPINIVSEHGASYKYRGQEWQNESAVNNEWIETIRSVMKNYVQRCTGSFIEVKNYSIVWHYRNSDPERGLLRATELYNELLEYTNSMDIQVVKGNKIVEVRNKGVNKGVVTKRILQPDNYDFILACGDDATDEDMFYQLTGVENAYTIKVGTNASFAKYNLHTPQMVLSLLEVLNFRP